MSAWHFRDLGRVGWLRRLRLGARSEIEELMASFRGDEADTFSQVLLKELEFFRRQGRLGAARSAQQASQPKKKSTVRPDTDVREERTATERAHRSQLVGLAFSGGGIRSATFNLGVLQGLAHLGLLRCFHYLSTVSGGGYIGSWLVSWMYRERIDTVEWELPREIEGQSESAQRLRHRRGSPVTFLRAFSNYLTPKTGALSVDTWSLVATYVRNLVLNLTIVVLFLGSILLVPRILVAWDPAETYGRNLFFAAAVLLVVAICVVAQNFDRAREVHKRHLTSSPAIFLLAVLPLFCAGASASFGFAWLKLRAGARASLESSVPWWVELAWWMALAGVAYFAFWLVALVGARLRSRWSQARAAKRAPRQVNDQRRERPAQRFPWILGMALPAGAGGGAILRGVFLAFPLDPIEQTIWGPPAVVLTFIFTAVLHIGLMGRAFADEHREWWSRLGGWLCILLLGWTGLFAVVFYGPAIFRWLGTVLGGGLGIGWLVATAAGIWAGRSPATGGRGSKRGVEIVALVAPYVFIGGLLIALALGIHEINAWVDKLGVTVTVQGLAIACALATGMTVLLSWRVDINEFSMHLFYRNRLIRPYLGASRRRQPIPFTGFDPEDDLPLHWVIDPKQPGGHGSPYRGPLPIINTTINLTAGEELAWQERKANSFFLTPLYYGFDPGRMQGAEGRGFRRTFLANRGEGITLGTAMAISGAAVNPNMGYHSSPALSFLLTVFNARLGWWLRNPARRRGWSHHGPTLGLLALLRELTGAMGSKSTYVNLADGGFFDNLGIYELVRRRCRFILACDVEADPQFGFHALGNAIRKCRSDFGIDIDIDVEPIRKSAKTGFSRWHCAVGTIDYARIDENAPKGTLIYLKASLTGDEPEDLQNYQKRFSDFPHESTADQWFGESQFESYRKLGYHQAIELFGAVGLEPRRRGGEDKDPSKLPSIAREVIGDQVNIESVFVDLRQAWYPPSHRVEASFTRHARLLDEIFERLRARAELDYLDEEFYVEIEEWKRGRPMVGKQAPGKGGQRVLTDEQLRQGFYLCNSMIQLMENVYLDLDLEREWQHPDNRGWMNLFLHWSWSRTFRQTWSISASTYGARFQTFCQRRLGLELGFVWAERMKVDPAAELGKRWAKVKRLHDERRVLGLEHRLLRELIEREAGHFYLLKVVVLMARASEEMRATSRFETRRPPRDKDVVFDYTVGIAAVGEHPKDQSQCITFLRIRDHLRRLGLGRASILRLIADHGVTRARILPDTELQRFYHRIDRARFGDLFKSVWNEYEKWRYPASWIAEVPEVPEFEET